MRSDNYDGTIFDNYINNAPHQSCGKLFYKCLGTNYQLPPSRKIFSVAIRGVLISFKSVRNYSFFRFCILFNGFLLGL